MIYTLYQGGGGATSYTFSEMKSKRCSHNLQSDQQESCQQNCVLIMRFTSKTIESTEVENEINGFENEQKHGGPRRDCFSLLYFGNSQIY